MYSVFLRYTILITSFLLIADYLSYGQDDAMAIGFIEKLIRENQPEGQIVYTDKISKEIFDKIKSGISKSTITGISGDTKQNSIILTRQEKRYLIEESGNFTYPFWGENLFSNSKMIKEDDSFSYIKKAYQDYSESYNNPNNTETDRMTLVKNYQRPNVFTFTKPLFFRDKTFCLVYFSSICGNPCGFDELCFYKFENNVWKKWVVVNAGVY